jgi:hypothetical protein
MIKVYQNRFTKVDENGIHITKGNCYTACLASLLECKIEDLPAFHEFQADGSWFTVTFEILKKYGLTMDVNHKDLIPEYYSIALGPSPRGHWGHAVIYYKDKLFHDPHPEGNGLKSVDQYLVIKSLK